MSEKLLREKLAEIDRLRDLADQGETMRNRWDRYNDEEVVESVTVKRRWLPRSSKRTIEELAMTPEEIGLFRDWLLLRIGQLRLKADELAEELTIHGSRTP